MAEVSCYGMMPTSLPWRDAVDDPPPTDRLVFVLGWRDGQELEESLYAVDKLLPGGEWEFHAGVLAWAFTSAEEEEQHRLEQLAVERMVFDDDWERRLS